MDDKNESLLSIRACFPPEYFREEAQVDGSWLVVIPHLWRRLALNKAL